MPSKSLILSKNENIILGFEVGANLGITYFNKDKKKLVTSQLDEDEIRLLKSWLNCHYKDI